MERRVSPGSNHLAAECVAKTRHAVQGTTDCCIPAFKGDKLSVLARRAIGIELGIASSAPFDLSSLTFGGGMGSERLLGPEHNIQIGARIALDHIDALFSTVTVSVCYGAIAAGVLVAALDWLGAVNPWTGTLWTCGITLCAVLHILLCRAYIAFNRKRLERKSSRALRTAP